MCSCSSCCCWRSLNVRRVVALSAVRISGLQPGIFRSMYSAFLGVILLFQSNHRRLLDRGVRTVVLYVLVSSMWPCIHITFLSIAS